MTPGSPEAASSGLAVTTYLPGSPSTASNPGRSSELNSSTGIDNCSGRQARRQGPGHPCADRPGQCPAGDRQLPRVSVAAALGRRVPVGLPGVCTESYPGRPDAHRRFRTGCFIKAVVTRRQGHRREEHGLVYRIIARALARGQSAAVKDLIGRRDDVFNSAMEALEQRRSNGIKIRGVFPSDESKLVGRTTFGRSKLPECAAEICARHCRRRFRSLRR
jgi:hypothetical protein